MTKNSKEAYDSTVELRKANKEIVFKALLTENNQSRFEIGRKTGLGDIESQRRLSDLYNEGKIIITGKRKHFKCDVSLYSVKHQLELYPLKRPMRLKDWMKKHHPEILYKYEALELKKL